MKRLCEWPSPLKQESIVERLAIEAIGLGADVLEVEYKDGYERAFAAKAGMGFRHCQLSQFKPGSRRPTRRVAPPREAEAAYRRARRTQVRATSRHL